ncbi:MAG TPA: asparaginase [Acidobacteriota bacterium]|nr:asparaginase [Acidobacteriota bacterium]
MTGTTENMMLPVAVEVTRGDAIESVHCGVAVAVDYTGKVIAHFGDPEYVTFSRSSLKPLQALPTVMRGFPECLGLEDRHLAVICGSHSGEECHVQATTEILNTIGRTVDDFGCGVHVPIILRNPDGPMPDRAEFSQVYNNCSGKHAGMLALAQMLDCPPADYLLPASPVQRRIREIVIEMTGVPAGAMYLGTDGCSAPNYAMPIRCLAHGFARLAQAAGARTDAHRDDLTRGAARVMAAMRSHPEMVSGTGRFDLALAEASRGRCIVKVGGEAIECIAVPERGWGIVVKVADGNVRGLGPFVVDVLRQLDVLDDAALTRLAPLARPELKNHRGIVVGTARSVARLRMN